MKPIKYIAILGVLHALTISVSAYSAQAEGKGRTSQRGGRADTHMSTKGQDNTNAQWSADPERGWVRSDERNDQQKQNTKEKKARGKQAKNSKW